MKATYIAGLFASAIGFVAAQSSTVPFYITNPIQGSVFEAGSTETITWSNGIDETAKVTLLTGTNSLTMKPTDVSFSINGGNGEYDWKVPTDLPQNATFSLQIEYKDANGTAATSYSSAFTITGTTGTVVTASFVTGTSSVSAIATAVSSVSAVSTALPSSSVIPSSISQITHAASATSSSAAPSASSSTSAAVEDFKASSFIVCGIAFIASSLLF